MHDKPPNHQEIEKWEASRDFWRHGRAVVWWSALGIWIGGAGQWIASAVLNYLREHIHWSP